MFIVLGERPIKRNLTLKIQIYNLFCEKSKQLRRYFKRIQNKEKLEQRKSIAKIQMANKCRETGSTSVKNVGYDIQVRRLGASCPAVTGDYLIDFLETITYFCTAALCMV